jgi:hypothetical protein
MIMDYRRDHLQSSRIPLPLVLKSEREKSGLDMNLMRDAENRFEPNPFFPDIARGIGFGTLADRAYCGDIGFAEPILIEFDNDAVVGNKKACCWQLTTRTGRFVFVVFSILNEFVDKSSLG